MRQKQIKTHYIQWRCLHCMRCDTTNPSACATSCDYVVDVWLISQRSPDSHRVPDDPVQTLSVSKNAQLKSKPLETISSGYSLNWDTSARFCLHADLVIGSANILSFSTSMLFLCGTTKVVCFIDPRLARSVRIELAGQIVLSWLSWMISRVDI